MNVDKFFHGKLKIKIIKAPCVLRRVRRAEGYFKVDETKTKKGELSSSTRTLESKRERVKNLPPFFSPRRASAAIEFSRGKNGVHETITFPKFLFLPIKRSDLSYDQKG